ALRQVVSQWQADPARHFAVMFLDFDRFKQVNDKLGHAAGDELLRQIAERLQSTLRDVGYGRHGDTLARGTPAGEVTAARLGGDEFVVLLADLLDPADATVMAERLLQVLAQPYVVRGQRLHSSASIGLVTSAQPECDADSLLRDADTAMYEAKRAGRGRWVMFEPRMQAEVLQRATLEADLHEALARGELFVVYQPVLTLDGHQTNTGCAGVEALVRWRHPERGIVAPGQFIHVAEEAGLIGALGLFVLETACLQFMRWRLDLGPQAPRMLAVNLSVAQLCQADLVAQISQALADCAMPPACLQLEVTESLAAQDPASLGRLLALKALGVNLALDDFGTGYSSLSCLHQLPVDTVKIDRSFVIEAEHSEYHRALIEATVRVARTLRMSTVAEGIETDAQSALVQSLGCDLGQGYLYSRPMAAEALTLWLAERELVRRAATPPLAAGVD
ncbi:MAG TPA: EAL domain-containing protein, partial [Hyphomicrobiaceae bacterium]|nr:EAL domain-containing protein [Hyphomicrobiaceae bacterium]